MELRTLRYFLAVAREGNMTGAANVLYVTQPTLSRQIADLERELGVVLFERTNRACVLTADGMRLRQRAEEILALVEQTERELADREGGVAGSVRIGAGETRAMRVVLSAFSQLRGAYPDVTIDLCTGNADAVEERLERGLLDFALLLEPVNLDKYESVRMPAVDRVGVCVAADAWSDGAISPERLNVVGRFDLIGNASYLVRTGVACAMGIEHLVQVDDDSQMRFIPLDPPLTIASFLVWKKNRLRSRACEEFLRCLGDTLASAGDQ